MKKIVSIILPTLNERENIKEVIDSALYHIKHPVEILVVDDDSKDKTWQYVQDLEYKNVRVIRRMKNPGIAASVGEGIEKSLGDIVVWLDADMSHPPKHIPHLLEEIDKGYDIVIASRFVPGGKDLRSKLRIFTSYLFNLYANILLGRIRDYDSGFIAVNKKVFDKIKFPGEGYGYYFIKFVYECKKNGFKIKEIPFVNVDREKGVSKTADSFLKLLKWGFIYGKEVWKIKFGK